MAVVRRALLIGSQTGGLTGVHGDIERMRDALADREFRSIEALTQGATRDAILTAYRRLIDDAERDDAVCIYYSGHGSFLKNPDFVPGQGRPQVLQYIIPTDDGPADFRGIMNFELSRLLAELTNKTRNVTLILDCCHAGGMSRDAAGLTPKALAARVGREKVAELLAQSAAAAALVDVTSNPHAVRLVAAEPETTAFEHIGEHGLRTGVLTEAWLKALAEAVREAVPWTVLGTRIRELVMRRVPAQRPDVEGPRERRLWSTEVARGEQPLAFFFHKQEPRLRAGWLLGARPGAQYAILPAGSAAYAEAETLARATVTENVGSESRIALADQKPGATLQDGLPAFPLQVPFERHPVLVAPDAPAALREAIAGSRYLLEAPLGSGGAPSTIAREGDGFALRDPLGDLLAKRPESRARELAEPLEQVARAERFRELDKGGLRVKLTIEFGRVLGAQRFAMSEGDTFHVGDHLYVSVANVGYDECQVGVFNIDASYGISLLSNDAARGYMVRHGNPPLLVGLRVDGSLLGLPARWPHGLPEDPENPKDRGDRSRRESLIVIAADQPQDFPLLVRANQRAAASGPPSGLEAAFAQVFGGGTRAAQTRQRPSEYALFRFDYRLSPEPRRPAG